MRFDRRSIYPQNEAYLIDDYLDTCSVFAVDGGVPKFTQFRVTVSDVAVDFVNLMVIGSSLQCGRNLYVTPLSATETMKWEGRWNICQLFQTSLDKGKESCYYRCKCSDNCADIQVMKVPLTLGERSWTLCHICFVDNIRGNNLYKPLLYIIVPFCTNNYVLVIGWDCRHYVSQLFNKDFFNSLRNIT